MCWACDHPDSTRADYLERVADVMACCGWAVQGVERDRLHPPWAYTIGLTLAGEPELVVTGLPLTQATELLNGVAAHLLHAPAPKLGEQVELTNGRVIQIIKVTQPSAHLEIAVELFGPRIRALQIVHADDRGHWPWNTGYRGIQGGQPVLGQPVLSQPAPTKPNSSSAPPLASGPAGSRHPADQRATTRHPSRRQQSRRATRRARRRSTRPLSRPPTPPH
jgi:Domain of unknown function (DUF4262)